MSKLDNIQTTCDNCEYTPVLSETCKQRIKDLFLEIISENLEPEYGIATVENKAQVIGDISSVKNAIYNELRQKVEEL